MKTITCILYIAVVAGGRLEAQILPTTQPPRSGATAADSSPTANSGISAGLPVPISSFVDEQNYVLRAGDTVSFQVLEDRLLELQLAPTSLIIADSGEVDVPYIGRAMAAGKTPKELAAEIKAGLEKTYYKKATVVLSLNLANRLWGRVYILGQVHAQGVLDVQVSENLTAGKAILRAGGFMDFANKKKVKVVRASTDGKSKTFELDMKDILENGAIEKDILLEPNDLIVVPTRLINF